MFHVFDKKSEKVSSTHKKVVFKIDGMHCVSCSLNIDGELEDTQGVMSASTSYARSMCQVTFDSSKVKEKDLVKIIQKLGYTVTDVR